MFSMPYKSSDLARERKREWYQKNKDLILKRKRERHAAQKKQRPPRPKPPAPTPEQITRTRALNKKACQGYRATHLAQVRFINRVYYHKNRERIVQQQRDRRAARKNPFGQLCALADVCSERLYELNHGPASEEETRPPTAVSSPKECGCGRHRGCEGLWPPTILQANHPSQGRGRMRGLQTAQVPGRTAALSHHASGATGGNQTQELDSTKGLEGENDPGIDL